ncbi:hypothetical protein ES705_47357 [subsurface metagenome]
MVFVFLEMDLYLQQNTLKNILIGLLNFLEVGQKVFILAL